jgi:hypothetical protein
MKASEPAGDRCTELDIESGGRFVRRASPTAGGLAQAPRVRRRAGVAEGAHISGRARSNPGPTPAAAAGVLRADRVGGPVPWRMHLPVPPERTCADQ